MRSLFQISPFVFLLTLTTLGCESKEEPPTPQPEKEQTKKESPGKPTNPEKQPEEPKSQPTASVTVPPAVTEEVSLQTVTKAQYEQIVEAYKGKVVVVDFWGTWCSPCVRDFPQTVAWRTQYSPDDVVVISMAIDGLRLADPENPESTELESPDQLKASIMEFLREKQAQFPNLLSAEAVNDSPAEAFPAYGIDIGLPHFKIYDRSGKLFKAFPESFDQEVTHELIEAAIEEALKSGPMN